MASVDHAVECAVSNSDADELTSAVLRLECSLDCVSGSVGHQHRSYRLLYHSQHFL